MSLKALWFFNDARVQSLVSVMGVFCSHLLASLSEMDSVKPSSINVSGGIGPELPLHSEVHSFEGERAGVTNPGTRRKLQSRLINVHRGSLCGPGLFKCTQLDPRLQDAAEPRKIKQGSKNVSHY
jgi:hypothetical protein